MSHGIKQHDVGFIKGRTWHQLKQYKQLNRGVTLDEAVSCFKYEDSIRIIPNEVTIWNDGCEVGTRIPSTTNSIVRTDKNIVLNGAVKNRYTLCNMEGIVRLAYSQVCEAYNDEDIGDKIFIESVGTLDNGAIQFISIAFDMFQVHGDDSPTINRLMSTNDYSGGGHKTLVSQVRTECKNTRALAIETASDVVVTKHTASINDKIKSSLIQMGHVLYTTSKDKQRLDKLALAPELSYANQKNILDYAFPIKQQDGEEITKGSINKNKQDKVMSLYTDGQDGLSGKYARTPYAFFNAITNVVGQETGKNGTSGDWDNMTGNRAKLKERTLKRIEEVVA